MKVILKIPIKATDFSQAIWDHGVVVEPGSYELVRIPNPTGLGVDWLVIQGTKIGLAEPVWREHLNKH